MIETLDDAIQWCNTNNQQKEVIEFELSKEIITDLQKDVLAYLELRIITIALNEEWIKIKQKRWFPWFLVTNTGEITFNCSLNTYSEVGFKFYYKSKEISDYCGNHFIDIWRDFLISR